MNDHDVTAVLERLVEPLDDEAGDWIDVLGRVAERLTAPDPGGRRRFGWLRAKPGVVLLCTATVAVAAAVLTVAAPWGGAPSILDRAAAAIPPSTSGQVLAERLAIRGSVSGRIDVHVWIDGTRSPRFRLTWDTERSSIEFGGTLGKPTGLSYWASDNTLAPVAFQGRVSRTVLDPAAFIRQSIESGEAEPAGETTIRGQRVIRIRVSSPRYSLLEPAALYFVDARTYRPVRIVIIRTFPPPDPVPFGLPLTSLTDLLVPSLGALRGGGMVVDFEEYRLLAPTVANRRMAHIRAQHPKARIG